MYNTFVVEEKDLTVIYSKIIAFVSDSPRTRAEVVSRLAKYIQKQNLEDSEKENVKEQLLLRINDENLLDDRRYAKDFISNTMLSSKPRSKFKIKQFLIKKGISEAIISSEIMQIDSQFEERNVKKELEKKARLLNGLEEFKLRNKLKGYLIRKGYSPDLVNNVVDTYLGVK